MTISITTINRIKRVIGEIATNTQSTSPGPWYRSHGHVISPGPKLAPLANGFVPTKDFDVCSQPWDTKQHTVYGINSTSSGSKDMLHIATCEPVRMKKLTDDIAELLAEREDITAVATLLDTLMSYQIGKVRSPEYKKLNHALTAYLASLS